MFSRRLNLIWSGLLRLLTLPADNCNYIKTTHCRTGNFHDWKILCICGVGRFATGKFHEFLDCRAPGRVIFKGRKFSRISRFSQKSQTFLAHENFLFYSSMLNDYWVTYSTETFLKRPPYILHIFLLVSPPHWQ